MHLKFTANMNETERDVADATKREKRKQINNDD